MPTILITPPTFEPVTLAQVKANCRIDGADEDALIGTLISAAREMAEQITGRSLATQTWERVLDAFPCGEIELYNPPVAAIVSVKYIDLDGVEQTLDSSLYALDSDSSPAWLLPAWGTDWPTARDSANALRVRYTAGYAEGACPQAIQHWLLAMVAHAYRNREAASDKPMQRLPFLDGLLDRYRVF